MSNHFILYHTINLSAFIVKIYTLDSSANTIDYDYLNSLTNILNKEKYPRGILEQLESINEIAKVEIFDYNNNLILNSQILL